MKKIFENKFLIVSLAGALLLFGLIIFILLSATATTKAAVLTQDVPAGTTITEDLVTEIDVPKDTPGDFYKSVNAIIGERTTGNISANQLIYPSNLMTNIEVDADSNENYVLASMKVSDDNAIGGLLTAGDHVDVAVVPNDGESSYLASALPGFDIDGSLNGGFYYILANVELIDTTTAVSSAQGTNMAAAAGDDVTSGGSSNGESYYMISLSYNDYKKLRLAEQYGRIYLNLSPKQNNVNKPLIEEMAAPVEGGLTDANDDTTAETRIAVAIEDDANAQMQEKKTEETNASDNANDEQPTEQPTEQK